MGMKWQIEGESLNNLGVIVQWEVQPICVRVNVCLCMYRPTACV